jgi:hypothetical protein
MPPSHTATGKGTATPVPLTDKLKGEPVALWVTLTLALREPRPAGVKATDKVQLPPGATLTPAAQVPALVNSAA